MKTIDAYKYTCGRVLPRGSFKKNMRDLEIGEHELTVRVYGANQKCIYCSLESVARETLSPEPVSDGKQDA